MNGTKCVVAGSILAINDLGSDNLNLWSSPSARVIRSYPSQLELASIETYTRVPTPNNLIATTVYPTTCYDMGKLGVRTLENKWSGWDIS